MARYLDPRADLTFKRVFGEHKDLVISFLNAMLPLKDNELIESIEYLSPEMVPDHPMRKFSIVDVRCTDQLKRQFIVEMQMYWTKDFEKRMMLNTSKAIVQQVGTGEDYRLLQPVYSLNILNDTYAPELDGYYHPYALVNQNHPEKVIEGLRLVIIELPKFKPQTYNEKKMQVLWLRYLTEIDDNTDKVAPELLEAPELRKAIDILERSAFTEPELARYDKFWDTVSTEKTALGSAHDEGYAEELAEGEAKGRAEGVTEGKLETARNLLKMGVSPNLIAQATGLKPEQIDRLSN